MRSFLIAILFIATTSLNIFAQDLQPYKIYNSNGKSVKFKKLIKKLNLSEVILFGELHNNPICHWLQLETTKALAKESALVLGAEMFITSDQAILDLYLANKIDADGLDSLIKLWPNYDTDYAPLVDFAKENKLPFIGSNIPRKYASQVYRHGLKSLDTLPEFEKQFIAPLPIEYDGNLPAYKAMLEMGHGHGGENMPKAQAIKDATMAHFIFKNLMDNSIFMHFNGTYHSNNYEGIYWYLKQLDTDINISTIASVEQENIDNLSEENIGIADFIICVDADMTKGY